MQQLLQLRENRVTQQQGSAKKTKAFKAPPVVNSSDKGKALELLGEGSPTLANASDKGKAIVQPCEAPVARREFVSPPPVLVHASNSKKQKLESSSKAASPPRSSKKLKGLSSPQPSTHVALLKGIAAQDSGSNEDTTLSKRDDGSNGEDKCDDGNDSPPACHDLGEVADDIIALSSPPLDKTPSRDLSNDQGQPSQGEVEPSKDKEEAVEEQEPSEEQEQPAKKLEQPSKE